MNGVTTGFTIIGATVALLGGLAALLRSIYERGYSRGFGDALRLVEERVRAEVDAEVRSLKKAVEELEVKLAATRRKRWRVWGRQPGSFGA
jgi:hypothetical protein